MDSLLYKEEKVSEKKKTKKTHFMIPIMCNQVNDETSFSVTLQRTRSIEIQITLS